MLDDYLQVRPEKKEVVEKLWDIDERFGKIAETKRDIARVKTVIREKEEK